jgi:tryptophan synthase alpha chain
MSEKNKLLIPFFTAGHPKLESTNQLILAFAGVGADYIEVGLAHSDALADGPVIQHSSHMALQNGMNIELLFKQVAELKPAKILSKLVLFSYFNPLLAYGLQKALKAWKEAGGSCVLIPDLPLEEADNIRQICKEENLKLIFLVAPTSTPERIKRIVEASEEFIYLVSVTGVTGARESVQNDLTSLIQSIKSINPKIPVVVGFGISNPAQAKKVIQQGADGVVVGSALVKLVENEGIETATKLLSEIKKEI